PSSPPAPSSAQRFVPHTTSPPELPPDFPYSSPPCPPAPSPGSPAPTLVRPPPSESHPYNFPPAWDPLFEYRHQQPHLPLLRHPPHLPNLFEQLHQPPHHPRPSSPNQPHCHPIHPRSPPRRH